MIRGAAALLVLWAVSAWAGYRVQDVAPLSLGEMEGSGQVADPRPSPDGRFLAFEFLGAEGKTLEVYVAPMEGGPFPPALGAPNPVLPRTAEDPFRLGGSERPVSEGLSWGPTKRDKPSLVVSATRAAGTPGAAQVSFDLYLWEPGRRLFLTQHPENDVQPAFSPGGDVVAFASGRTGQGDIYLHHFFARSDPLIRVTHEVAGSELYPAWDPAGERLVFTGHLFGQDHVYVLDGVRRLVAETDAERRRGLARSLTRDLTPAWKTSCLAASVSPDGKWVAFYVRDEAAGGADLYVVSIEGQGGEPRRVLRKGLPETHGGPRWSPRGDGFFAVLEDAGRMNPLVWVPLESPSEPRVLPTGTELNADPFPLVQGDGVVLLFTAQGREGSREKRWRRIYAARLIQEVAR